MPDSFSARGPTPARLFPAPFSQGSKSQCALIWLKRTVEKAWPWGAAAEYRRQRTLVWHYFSTITFPVHHAYALCILYCVHADLVEKHLE